MVVVKVEYPGKNFYYGCDREAAAWLVAQFANKEWTDAAIYNSIEEAQAQEQKVHRSTAR